MISLAFFSIGVQALVLLRHGIAAVAPDFLPVLKLPGWPFQTSPQNHIVTKSAYLLHQRRARTDRRRMASVFFCSDMMSFPCSIMHPSHHHPSFPNTPAQ